MSARRFASLALPFVVAGLAVLVMSRAWPALEQPAHPAVNAVVAFLDGAERQAESPEQEREIARALQDLKSLPADALAKRRYADYALAPGRWTLAELIGKYFVPRERTRLDPAPFYRDARDPRAIAVIDAHLAAIREHRQVSRTP